MSSSTTLMVNIFYPSIYMAKLMDTNYILLWMFGCILYTFLILDTQIYKVVQCTQICAYCEI